MTEILVAEPGRADDGMDAVGGEGSVSRAASTTVKSTTTSARCSVNCSMESSRSIRATSSVPGSAAMARQPPRHLPCGSDNSYTDHVCRLGPRLPPSVARSSTVPGMFAAIGDTLHNIMLLLHVLTGFVAFAPAMRIPSCRPRHATPVAPSGLRSLGTSPRTRCGSMAVP